MNEVNYSVCPILYGRVRFEPRISYLLQHGCEVYFFALPFQEVLCKKYLVLNSESSQYSSDPFYRDVGLHVCF